MQYRLDIESPQGASATFEIHAVTLASAEKRAITTGQGKDSNGVCSLSLRIPNSPELLRRADSPRGPWYWLRCGARLPKDAALDSKTLRAWSAL
jgi:hypothetical protein